MSHDGCEEVAWKGKAFPYLMHHPNFHTTENYGSAKQSGEEIVQAVGARGGGSRRLCGPHNPHNSSLAHPPLPSAASPTGGHGGHGSYGHGHSSAQSHSHSSAAPSSDTMARVSGAAGARARRC